MLPFLNNLFSGPQVGEDGTYTSGVYKGMTEKTAGALNAGVGLVSGIAGNLLSNGMSTGVGDTLQSLSGVASAIPGVGTLVGAGLNVVGGLVNGAFGSKLNAQGIANAQQDIAKLNNFNANAGSFDEFTALTGPQAQGFSQSDIGKDGWFSSKAKKKYNELKALQTAALARAQASMQNNASNLVNDNNLSLMSNLAAFGGPLHSYGTDWTNGLTIVGNGGTHEQNPYEGVPMGIAEDGQPNLVEEGEAIYNDYVFSKRIRVPKAVRQKYKLRGPQEMTFADAAKYAQKESEERPNDPISQRGLQDIMNKLMIEQESIRQKRQERKMQRQYAEGGEIHIAPSKRGTFTAAASKHNMGVQEFASKVLANPEDYSPAMRKKANFARNASKWKHAYGGPMGILYEGTGPYSNLLSRPWPPRLTRQGVGSPFLLPEPAIPEDWKGEIQPGRTYPGSYPYTAVTEPTTTSLGVAPTTQDSKVEDTSTNRGLPLLFGVPSVTRAQVNHLLDKKLPSYNLLDAYRETIKGKSVDDTIEELLTKPQEKATESTKKPIDRPKGSRLADLRYVPALGLGIASLTDALGWTNRPDYSDADAVANAVLDLGAAPTVKYNPPGDYMRYEPLDPLFYGNRMAAIAGANRRNILNTSGGNRGAAMAGLLASDYNAQTALADADRKGAEYNFGTNTTVSEFNQKTNFEAARGDLEAQIANARNRTMHGELASNLRYRAAALRAAERERANQAKMLNLSNFFESIGDIGREEYQRNTMMSTPFSPYYLDRWGSLQYKS